MARPKRSRDDAALGQEEFGNIGQAGANGSGPMAQENGDDPGDSITPDTTLRLKGGDEFHVHGFLLRLASPVLRIGLSGPKVNGRWQLELPDETLASWQLLYQAISPDSEDIFLRGPFFDAPCVEKLDALRPVLGLAHKYGIERVVQQSCTFMYTQVANELARTPAPSRGVDRQLLRGVLLWLDTLLRFDLQAEYDTLYGTVVSNRRVQRADLVDTVDRLRREGPAVLLHSQLLTDFLVRFVDRNPAPSQSPNARRLIIHYGGHRHQPAILVNNANHVNAVANNNNNNQNNAALDSDSGISLSGSDSDPSSDDDSDVDLVSDDTSEGSDGALPPLEAYDDEMLAPMDAGEDSGAPSDSSDSEEDSSSDDDEDDEDDDSDDDDSH